MTTVRCRTRIGRQRARLREGFRCRFRCRFSGWCRFGPVYRHQIFGAETRSLPYFFHYYMNMVPVVPVNER